MSACATGSSFRPAAQGPGWKIDGFLVLNPNMPVLAGLFQQGEALIVHAAATAYRDRSHFDGQDVLKSGRA